MVEKISSQTVGQENIDALQLESIKAVIIFLDTNLQNFPLYFKQITIVESLNAEDDISQELCVYLDRLARKSEIFMFQFQRKIHKSRRSSDIGVLYVEHHNVSEPSKVFFVIEAKVLPPDRKSREKEYVEGNLGGIERFKRGHHGNGLPQSAIVGYIQKETCSHWHGKINEWINELIKIKREDIIWNEKDLLKHLSDFGRVQKYHSQNTRKVNSTKDSIELHHYLMELI